MLTTTDLPIVVARDPEAPEFWIAHCLKGDHVGQGSSPDEALQSLHVCVLYSIALEEGDPFVRRAPQEYWTQWEDGERCIYRFGPEGWELRSLT